MEAVGGKPPRGAGTDAAATGRDDRNLAFTHGARNHRAVHGNMQATEPIVHEAAVAIAHALSAVVEFGADAAIARERGGFD